MSDLQRNPVLLIHGIDDTAAVFWKMKPYLEKQGWVVDGLDLAPNNGSVGLDQLAQQVADYVEKSFAPDQPLDLVGFSMGGIISRYYVQRLNGLERVQRFITIASPHQGTWAAYFRNNSGCLQMRPGSFFLSSLNEDKAQLEQLNFTSIWTPFDMMILPASSSQLFVGREVKIQVLSHPGMLTDLTSLKAVAAALSAPLSNPPQLASQPTVATSPI